jgi:hypothetical protein
MPNKRIWREPLVYSLRIEGPLGKDASQRWLNSNKEVTVEQKSYDELVKKDLVIGG